MPTGFIYVMTTVTRDYQQEAFCNVPTQWNDRIYFGPCKIPMRPRMNIGDFVFGISPSSTSPRRILFAVQVEERITFAEAYERFPELRGPSGPIHVRPIRGRGGAFPASAYEHIPGSIHAKDWERDLAFADLDRFFVCFPRDAWRNRWLGESGPEIDDAILTFLRSCPVFGKAGWLASCSDGTKENPIAHGRLYQGLHLETRSPERLLGLCGERLGGVVLPPATTTPRLEGASVGRCGCSEEPAVAPVAPTEGQGPGKCRA